MSAKTTLAPTCNTMLAVAIKVNGVVIISSSFDKFKASNEACIAEDPELTVIAFFVETKLAN